MLEICDLCRLPTLDQVYHPQGTARGLAIHLCRYCELVQSLPRIDHAPRRAAAPSGGADWGNVRYGKSFRTEACLSLLKNNVDLSRKISILDVGSNRGSFARAFLDSAPQAQFTAVEPDERVAHSVASLPRTDLVQARIENTSLPASSFDIVHSCHTIEHLASPLATLADHWRVLKPGGLLLVDAPNIAFITNDDVVEEWFIDKHLYHFSAVTLAELLNAAGFDIVAGPDAEDRENLLFLAKKRAAAPRPVSPNATEVAGAEKSIAVYVATRARNLSSLTAIAAELTKLAPQRVALWGAGRLFDTLVVHGGFDPRLLSALIDTHLKNYVETRHGVPLHGPEVLLSTNPGIIVVMSRAFAGEITRLAKAAVPHAEIVLYADLLHRANALRAA